MKSNLTRKKVSPKSHKKTIAFVYAEKLLSDDVNNLEKYLEHRNDLHYVYLIVSKNLPKKIITLCNRYNHIKLIQSPEPHVQIEDIKSQFDGVDIKFEERDFENLKQRSF